MELSALSKILWEQVKAGKRTLTQVNPESMRLQVIERANIDLANGIITQERYDKLITAE